MASHCYLVGPSGELFVEYLVRHCALSDQEINDPGNPKDRPFRYKRLEVYIRNFITLPNFHIITMKDSSPIRQFDPI